MNVFDRIIGAVAPRAALNRVRARTALQALMNYDAATSGRRGSSWKPMATDADSAAWGKRSRIAFVGRDMVRNTPLATRYQTVVVNNVVGDGIQPKVVMGTGRVVLGRKGPTVAKLTGVAKSLSDILARHLGSTDIDADGRNTLSGLQRLAMMTVVDSGEALIRRRPRLASDGLTLPFQLQVLEPDYLDVMRDGAQANGNMVRDGIEYDQIGRRVAYWMFKEHPGAVYRNLSVNLTSARVPASEVIHLFRQDRPGQQRGVSWFANLAMSLQDLADHQDAQLLRQKIAACFAAFRVPAEDEDDNADPSDLSETIAPGRIQNLGPGEDIKFAEPPGVQGYDEFKRSVLRDVASGGSITYEALSGDLSNVNFSSARIGRLEMDRAVTSWQWQMLIPQMMDPIARWVMEAFDMVNGTTTRRMMTIAWVPPHRMLVDPEGEINMSRNKVRAGFTSRSEIIRGFGEDPDEVMSEIIQDNADADANELVFDSDPRRVSLSGVVQTATPEIQSEPKEDANGKNAAE